MPKLVINLLEVVDIQENDRKQLFSFYRHLQLVKWSRK